MPRVASSMPRVAAREMSFAGLEVDDDGELHQKKPKANKSKDQKPQMTTEQKAILNKRKAEKEAKKEQKEKAKRCFYFDKCGSLRGKKPDGTEWPYCDKCFKEKAGECALCTEPTTLTEEGGGVFWEHCHACRHENVVSDGPPD
jgi:hypothetical protein